MTHDPWLEQVRFGTDGLVPVVAQDRRTGDVLMLAWANREALGQTLRTGFAHYWSRSRQALWKKGETSGHLQRVAEMPPRLRRRHGALPGGPDRSRLPHRAADLFLDRGASRWEHRRRSRSRRTLAHPAGHDHRRRAAERPPGSYTVSLLDHGIAKISQKVGEEAIEVVVAANAEDDRHLAAESADLIYHLLVLLRARGVELGDVLQALEAREK